MNYYSHNIGDYAQATMHLSLIEDAIYTRLLRRYYAEEQPIVDDLAQACRWVGARSTEEREAVPVILAEFFSLEDGFWRNKRADEEIAKYQAKAAQAAENGKKGGRPKSKQEPTPPQPDNQKETQPVISGLPEESESKANQEPRTNNQEPQSQKICAADASPTPAKGKRLAQDWSLPDDWFAWAMKTRPELGESCIRTEAEKFADHWHAATKNATKLDWLATWRNWIRNANAPRNVSQFPQAKSRFNNLPKINAAELNARADEAKRLGVVRANF